MTSILEAKERAPRLFGSAPKKLVIGKDNIDVFAECLKRGEREFFAQVINVTPEIAGKLLDKNDDNRTIRWKGDQRSVEAYAAAMLRGEWDLNGQTIIVSRDGFLNDGQHRLWAVIQADTDIEMLVSFGADRETRMTVDKGAAKTPGDTLKQHGEILVNILAHALQFVWSRENHDTFSYRPSPQQLLDTLDNHPAIRDSVSDVLQINKQKASVGYIAGAHYLCKLVNERVANEFLAGVLTGVGIASVDSPVSRFRERIARHAANRMADKLTADAQAALYVKAFNAYRRGKLVRVLSWRGRGDAPEEFPTPGA